MKILYSNIIQRVGTKNPRTLQPANFFIVLAFRAGEFIKINFFLLTYETGRLGRQGNCPLCPLSLSPTLSVLSPPFPLSLPFPPSAPSPSLSVSPFSLPNPSLIHIFLFSDNPKKKAIEKVLFSYTQQNSIEEFSLLSLLLLFYNLLRQLSLTHKGISSPEEKKQARSPGGTARRNHDAQF